MAKRKTIKSLEDELKEARKLNKTYLEANNSLHKKILDLEITKDSYRLKEEVLRRLIRDLKGEMFRGGFNLSKIGDPTIQTLTQAENQQSITVTESQTPSLIKILKGNY